MKSLPSSLKNREPLVGAVIRIDQLIPDLRNARKHSDAQIRSLRASIREFGFTNPILVDEQLNVITGHARLRAATDLGMTEVPAIKVAHLSSHQKRALAIADNRIAELATWDPDLLREELEKLLDIDFEIEATGFSTAEIDFMRLDPEADSADPDDEPLAEVNTVVTRPTDLWLLHKHRLYCGSSLEPASYDRLLGGERAEMIFADPPYNVPINGHVSGLGKIRHAEFAAASGEMSVAGFTEFLTSNFQLLAEHSVDGSIHYQCIDWRHLGEMTAAGDAAYDELKNVCVWAKTNGGMGALYRSQHELVFVWKRGTAPHVNNVELGKNGRYRTNVWTYAGANTFKAGRDEELAMHPTVKPVELVADAIRDCSRLGGLVLDPFGGSGTTLIAAERTRRRAALIELEPRYVDTTIRRWERMTGKAATLAETGWTFAEVAAERGGAQPEGVEP